MPLDALQPLPLVGADRGDGRAGRISLTGALVVGTLVKSAVTKIGDGKRGLAIQNQFRYQSTDDRCQSEAMTAETGGKDKTWNFLGKTQHGDGIRHLGDETRPHPNHIEIF